MLQLLYLWQISPQNQLDRKAGGLLTQVDMVMNNVSLFKQHYAATPAPFHPNSYTATIRRAQLNHVCGIAVAV
jgi:hypothetical protein